MSRDRDLVHRMHQRAVLDPVTARAARVIAGDRIHALPHQLRHEQARAHLLQQRVE